MTKIVFGIKIPKRIILQDNDFKHFKIYNIYDEKYVIFGIFFKEYDKIFEMTDEIMATMNKISELNVETEDNENFVNDVTKLLSNWSKELDVIEQTEYTEDTIKQQEYLDLPQNLEFNWYFING
jgi:hypothetical protein